MTSKRQVGDTDPGKMLQENPKMLALAQGLNETSGTDRLQRVAQSFRKPVSSEKKRTMSVVRGELGKNGKRYYSELERKFIKARDAGKELAHRVDEAQRVKKATDLLRKRQTLAVGGNGVTALSTVRVSMEGDDK